MSTSQPKLAVPDHIDEAAKAEPNALWARVPKSSISVDEGWRDITYAQLAHAVDSLAWSLENTIGAPDHIVLKVGYVPLFISPRNSPAGQKAILQETKCTLFLSTQEKHQCLKEIQEVIPSMRVFGVPSLLDLLDLSHPTLPYDGKHRRDGYADSLILHTSGSTGLPKAVRMTVDSLNSVFKQSTLDREEGRLQVTGQFLRDKRPMLAVVPFFHAMGIVVGLRSLMCRSSIATLPSGKLWNASLVINTINAINPATGFFPPSILEDISSTEVGIQAIGKLDAVFFGGAPLANASGEKLCRVTKLQTIIGSTEALLIPSLATTSSDEWGYFHWSNAAGAVMESTENDLCELVLTRRNTDYQAVFHIFPEEEKWQTKDLFQKHPSKPFLWRYSGRRDDTLVLSNGEKVNPVLMEKFIESHPRVKGAIVVGKGKFQTGLLIEPEWVGVGRRDPTMLVEDIWPTVKQANKEAPDHARIYKSKIAVMEEGKSFERTPKGSIMRLQTEVVFQDKITALYDDGTCASESSRELSSAVDLRGSVRAIFMNSLPSFGEETPDEVDICTLEVDSLSVLTLAEALRTTLQRTDITAATVYENPTVEKFVLALSLSESDLGIKMKHPSSREEELGTLVRKYTADLIQKERGTAARERLSKQTVLLTGSTGSLGSHVLQSLLQRPDVERVYCLNRALDAGNRQENGFKKYHYPVPDLSRVEFFQADFSAVRFGLAEVAYKRLVSTVTMVIHSAWSVNFNLGLPSYEATHIAGTRHLVDIVSKCVYKPSITFVSSIASVGRWGSIVQDGSPVPESTTTLFDRSIVLPQGYGESKQVAAEILAVASHRLGIQTAIIRASQLAGPSAQAGGAAWNRHEWLPSLVHTSKFMKKLPKTLGTMEQVDWVAMDVAGATVVDIAMAPTSQSTRIYHLANPHRTSWRQLYPVILEYFKSHDVEIDVIEYDDWVQELGRIPLTKENAEHIPGLKLCDFYNSLRLDMAAGLPRLATKNTEAVSQTLREGRAVDQTDMKKWLEQWRF